MPEHVRDDSERTYIPAHHKGGEFYWSYCESYHYHFSLMRGIQCNSGFERS